jgi:hypothetical protein
MKGVIVQVGNPKSIVLLNNGKIIAVPTPVNCNIGMVVTVKYSNVLKIVLVALAAVLLVALGFLIGAGFLGGKAGEPIPEMPWRGGGHHGRRHMMEQSR